VDVPKVSFEPRLALNHVWKEAPPPLPDKERGFSVGNRKQPDPNPPQLLSLAL